MENSRFIICRAAAGSGKTYTLVRQYLELAFSAEGKQLEKRFTHILAITFTNKAANEMKGRIMGELDAMVEGGVACPMGNDIALALGLDDDTLRRRASTVRSAILHNYSDLAVCTIDSFMHRIVRTFAHDLNLPMNFDVQIDRDRMVQSAVDELMALAGSEGQEELTEMLCEFAESRMNDGKSYMIERELATLAEELFKEQSETFLEMLRDLSTDQFREIQHAMAADNRRYESRMRQLGSEGVEIIANAGLAVEDFYHGANGAGGFFRRLKEGGPCIPNSYVLAYLEGEKLGAGKSSRATTEALARVKPPLQEVYRRYCELYDREGALYNSRRLLLKNIYSLALLNKLGELMGEYSRENEIVHISEFNKRIAAIVREEPAPFIYERLGNRYWNYLIDEFQDTSKMQWQNLVPLVENGVASNHTSLVVGDGKQAIYRFRQGDVEQFMELPHVESPLHGQMLEQPGVSRIAHLERNFRTGRTIVEFNNDFFEWMTRNRFGENRALQTIYLGEGEQAELCQTPVKEGGYVQVGFVELDKEHEPLWEEVLKGIERQVGELGYSYRDITLLARKKKILAEASTFLTERGVPVVSSESFLLTQSQVVMLLRSLLQYLVDGSDKVAAARVLIYLNNLGIVGHDYSHAFLEAKTAPVSLDRLLAADGLELDCDKLRQMGLYDCCEEALRMLHLDGIETAYTGTLLNVVARYSATHRQSLPEFLEWFDEQKEKLSTSTSTDMDAVRLMTIHKAKGLESPIVIYPIISKSDKRDEIWVHIDPDKGLPLPAGLVQPKKEEPSLFDEEYAEELLKIDMDRANLFYVALTRPKEKLLIYSRAPKKESSTDYPSMLQDYLKTRSDTVELRPQVFALGEDNPKAERKEAGESHNSRLTHLSFPQWTPRIAIADQSAAIFGELDESSIRRGNQLHELMSQIHHRDEADKVLAHYLAHHTLEEAEAALLSDTLHHMISQPEVARFFDPEHRCLNESDLVWQGEVLRPDRIVFTPSETWVVDFKSGAHLPKHAEQVNRYCQAVAAITHSDKVRGYLLYVGPDHCEVEAC